MNNLIKLKRKIYISAALFLMIPVLVFLFWPISYEEITGRSSSVLVSEEGNVLHVFRGSETGAYNEWISLDNVPESLIRYIILAEDKGFYLHSGFDLTAIARALVQNIQHNRVVSGGSTITQQLARLIWADDLPRNRLLRKIAEIFLAVRLEIVFSKNEILEAYINLIPLRNNRIGIASSARELFGRSIEFLTEEEMMALTIFIRRSAMSKTYFRQSFCRFYNEVVRKGFYNNKNKGASQISERLSVQLFKENGTANKDDKDRKKRRGENHFSRKGAAPHFVQWFDQKYPDKHGRVTTTISESLNKRVSNILNNELKSIAAFGSTNGAVLIVEIPDSDDEPLILRAMVGSKNFYDPHEGEVNGTVAIRSAGSTLKPFLYALAMDYLGLRPHSLIDDREIIVPTSRAGEMYRPQNYDMRFWGPLTVRDALANSRNIPAVFLIEKLGQQNFYKFLQDANFSHLTKGADHHGAGLALGSAGASLLQLVMAYSAFPCNGEMRPLKVGRDSSGNRFVVGKTQRLFSKKAASLVTHILADREARKRAFGKRNFLDFPFEVAAKTGTSSSYRDAWVIGYTRKYIVGVWVGDFEGKKMQGISGGWGAGRIFHQVMRTLVDRSRPKFDYPKSWDRANLCRITGKLAAPQCPYSVEIIPDGEKVPPLCMFHNDSNSNQKGTHVSTRNLNRDVRNPRIIAPVQGETFLIDPHMARNIQQIPFEIHIPRNGSKGGGYFYRVDDMQKRSIKFTLKKTIQLNRGNHRIMIYGGEGVIQTVEFSVR